MKHRHALLGAVALGLLVCLLLVGRVRAESPSSGDPPPLAWVPAVGATWRYQPELRECWRFRPLPDARPLVLDAGYALSRDAFRVRASAMGVAAIRQRLRLDVWRATC